MVTVDGVGVVSHAGTALLSQVADRVGLTAAFSEALDGLRQRRSGHDPGRMLVDVAVAVADGTETISDVQALGDQPGLHGPVASTATIWRVLDGVRHFSGRCPRPGPNDGVPLRTVQRDIDVRKQPREPRHLPLKATAPEAVGQSVRRCVRGPGRGLLRSAMPCCERRRWYL